MPFALLIPLIIAAVSTGGAITVAEINAANARKNNDAALGLAALQNQAAQAQAQTQAAALQAQQLAAAQAAAEQQSWILPAAAVAAVGVLYAVRNR